MASDKGWIIPPEVSDRRKCIKIYIPNDTYDRGAFWGALYELTYSWNWRAGGDTPPQDMANMWADIWREAYDRSNSMNCCDEQPILHRFNPETGRPEVSYNDGTTWVDDPADIQNSVPLYPPLVNETGDKTKCDAATNASEHFNDLIASTHTNLSAAATVFELAIAVAEAVLALFLILVSAGSLTAPVTAVATAIWAAATGAFALGIEAYDAYWSEDKKDAVLCALYCNIGDDGQFTEAQYQSWRAKVKDQLPASPALDIIMTSINAGGARGLSQMASYGNAALSDCASCVCDAFCGATWEWPATWFGTAPDITVNADTKTVTIPAKLQAGTYYAAYQSTSGCCELDMGISDGDVNGFFGAWSPCDDLDVRYDNESNPNWHPDALHHIFGSYSAVFARSSNPFTLTVTYSD